MLTRTARIPLALAAMLLLALTACSSGDSGDDSSASDPGTSEASASGSTDGATPASGTCTYNPDGSEEGYLFWTAWFFHNADSILSIEDAQGAAWRGGLITSCSTLAALPQTNPEMALLMPQLPVCPKDASR